MAPVFSVLLAELTSLTTGTHVIGSPPAGFKWVVRDIDAVNETFNNQQALGGFQLETTTSGGFAGKRFDGCVGQTLYHLEGRWVVENGQTLEILVQENGWNVRISGYKLTLP